MWSQGAYSKAITWDAKSGYLIIIMIVIIERKFLLRRDIEETITRALSYERCLEENGRYIAIEEVF